MRRCLVAVCCNQPTIFSKTAQSLMEIGWGDRVPYAKDHHGFDSVGFQWFTGSPRVDMMRNQAIGVALKRDYTHVIFLDADMVFPTDVIHRLLAHHDAGIVGGLYCLKSPPYSPVHLTGLHQKEGINQFYRLLEYGQELERVDVVGMGCTIIPLDVCRRMGESDWFGYANDKDGWPVVSEDVTFCLAAAEAGAHISVDPTIKCGHVTPYVIDDRHHHRYQSSVKASKEMGPSLSIREPEPA